MRKWWIPVGVAIGLLVGVLELPSGEVPIREQLQPGDIVFIQSQSSQSEALRLATKSPWTHVGVVILEDDQQEIIEAGPRGVATTSFEDFVLRSRGNRVAIYRLQRTQTPGEIALVRKALLARLGKPYDKLFRWNDDAIYCSEFIYDAYLEALKVELGVVQKFHDLDLSSQAVVDLLSARLKVTPEEFVRSGRAEEQVITPVALMKSDKLLKVYDGKVKANRD